MQQMADLSSLLHVGYVASQKIKDINELDDADEGEVEAPEQVANQDLPPSFDCLSY